MARVSTGVGVHRLVGEPAVQVHHRRQHVLLAVHIPDVESRIRLLVGSHRLFQLPGRHAPVDDLPARPLEHDHLTGRVGPVLPLDEQEPMRVDPVFSDHPGELVIREPARPDRVDGIARGEPFQLDTDKHTSVMPGPREIPIVERGDVDGEAALPEDAGEAGVLLRFSSIYKEHDLSPIGRISCWKNKLRKLLEPEWLRPVLVVTRLDDFERLPLHHPAPRSPGLPDMQEELRWPKRPVRAREIRDDMHVGADVILPVL